MIITIDCNSDTVRIENRKQDISLKIKHPNQILEVLVEIFNIMDIENYHIQLVKIDEDNRSIVGEW